VQLLVFKRVAANTEPPSFLNRIYNSVYLPSGAALADGLAGIQELEMLRQPMTAELAQTQLRVILELLYRLVSSLSAT
jgi:hypothetical protein